MSIINNAMEDLDITEATPGLYVTRNSVYMLYKSGDKYSLYKNGEKIADNISNATVRSFNDVMHGSDNEVSQLYYDNGGRTSDIKQYYKQIDSDSLLKGLKGVSEFLIEKGAKISDYKKAIERILRSNNDNNKDDRLIGLDTNNSINGSNYRIYSKEQYELMAMYISALNYYYPGFDYTKDARFRDVLHDMAIDSNGIASKLEEFAAKKEENTRSK